MGVSLNGGKLKVGEDITAVIGETGMNVDGSYAVYEGEPVEIGAGAGWDGSDNKGYFSGIIEVGGKYERLQIHILRWFGSLLFEQSGYRRH